MIYGDRALNKSVFWRPQRSMEPVRCPRRDEKCGWLAGPKSKDIHSVYTQKVAPPRSALPGSLPVRLLRKNDFETQLCVYSNREH